MARREFDPLTVFESLKQQNQTTNRPTFRHPIPAQLCPIDVRYEVVYATAAVDAFLSNEMAMTLLRSLGLTRIGNEDNRVVVGPVL